MANRGHVDVNERRLRPIYDNLDNGNNKIAVQLADKVLKKQKDLHCAKVLKALALFRMGKQNESFSALQEVAVLEPIDDPTLQAMSICYREMQKPDLVTKLFETALKKQPANEEFHSHLFMSYVRMSDYKKQQQAAMALYRQYPKNPYYFWAVMSIVMQAIFSPDENLSKKMFLPLALKMVEKHVKEDKIEAEAEVQLYLMILDLMKNYEESVKVLKSKLGEKITSEYNYHKYSIACLYAKLEKWPETNAAYRKLLLEEPDQWTFYVAYFKSAFALIEANWTPPEQETSGETPTEHGPPDHTATSVIQFIEDIYKAEKEKESKHQRGPFLARMELHKQLKERNLPDIEKLESLQNMLKEYFDLFGDKYCCFGDMAPYLKLLSEDKVNTFVKCIWDTLDLDPKDGQIVLASSEKQLQRHLTYLQSCRYLGLHLKMSAEEKITLSKELLSRHKEGMKFGASLLSTDLQPSDMYCLLAAHLLLDVWQDGDDSDAIWKAIAALEYGISKSPSNHHFKLLLIRVYCLLGAFGPCPELYDGMEIKHIQQDTLGYTVTRFCEPLGHFVSASAVYNATLKFFTVNNKDTTEYIISAYKYGSFPKIPEFVKFRQKLNNSMHYTMITTEKMLLEIMLEANHNNLKFEDLIRYMEIQPEKDEICWKDMTDNRDLGLLISWDPDSKHLSEQDKKDSFEMERDWLKISGLLLRSLAACALLTPPVNASTEAAAVTSNGTESPDSAETLKTLIGEFETCLQEVEKKPLTRKKFPLQGPPQTRTSQYLDGKHGSVILTMLKVTSDIQHLQVNGIDNSDDVQERIAGYLKEIIENLQGTLSQNSEILITECDGKKKFNSHILPSLVLLTESVSYLSLICGVCYKLLKPIKANIAKRNRKKKEEVNQCQQYFQSSSLSLKIYRSLPTISMYVSWK
ncbi:N-alpha-acetyltransferase 25, NatB auxiliary subunit-like [Ptychodera flava]|uniref:N-alpha-acetyltransferase 25, NatB auxiliary subunit-like n=1 Tax=Ptychodera flava TaxID=63121 RepID=UPI00396A0F51